MGRMKKTMLLCALAAVVGYFFPRSPARAYDGMMCINTSVCSKCEVCVKDKATDATGKCRAVAGCY